MDAHDVARLAALVAIGLMTTLVLAFLSDGWSDDVTFAHRDFEALHRAGVRALSGESPYARGTQPFVHPPLAIPLVALFGLAPSRVAFVLVSLVGVVAFGGALAILGRACGASEKDRATAIACAASAPSFFFSLFLGQLSGIYVLGFAGCLAALALGADVIAGICAGLLWIKPPLALALGFAILASRSRRAGAAMGVTGALLVACSLPWGLGAWSTWLSDARWWSTTLESAPGTWWRQWTFYSFVRASLAVVGVQEGAARAASLLVTLPLAVMSAWLGGRALAREGALRMRAAALLALATVALNAYLFYYDALLLVVPAMVAFLLRETYAPRARTGIAILAAISWVLQLVTPLFGQGGVPLPGLVATMWLVVEGFDLARALRSAPPARR